MIEGNVKGKDDEKLKPLPGATIIWKGSDHGTVADQNGNFSIEKHEHKTLIISYIGYRADTINVKNQKNLDIVLSQDLTLDEVNVEGKSATRTVSKSSAVNREDISLHGLRKAACCNLSESFETNPSVDVSYSDAVTGAKQIQLLGLDGIYTQMLTEKRPNWRGLGSKFGMNYIPGPWMESIQISKGVSSVQTGYQAITGQINVEYKKPEVENFHMNLYSNNQFRYEANLNKSFDVSDELGTVFYLHGSSMQNELDFNNDNFLDQPLTDNINLMNRWKYNGNQLNSNFGFNYIYEDRKAGQPGYPSENEQLYGIGIETNRAEFFLKGGYVFDTDLNQNMAFISNALHHKQNSFFGNNIFDAEQNSFYGNLIYNVSFCFDDHGNHEEDVHSEHEEKQHDDHDDKHKPEHSEHKGDSGPEPHELAIGTSIEADNYINTLRTKGLDSAMNRNYIVPGTFIEYTYKGIENLTMIAGFRADFHNQHGTFLTPRFNVKYNINQNTAFRVSAGKGYRVPDIIAENAELLASSRSLTIRENIDPEEAWNYGINISSDVEVFSKLFSVNAEYFRTDFQNQLIVDLEQSQDEIHFYNLNGESYSNSFQVDVGFDLFERLELLLAYRLTDVKGTIDGQLQDKYLVSRHKSFLNVIYTTESESWS